SSILRSAWLSADAETPSSVAAARKLRCRAIARKVARSEGSIHIDEFFSVACILFSGLSQLWRAAIPCPAGWANPPATTKGQENACLVHHRTFPWLWRPDRGSRTEGGRCGGRRSPRSQHPRRAPRRP